MDQLVVMITQKRERQYYDFSVRNVTMSFVLIVMPSCMRLFTIALGVCAIEICAIETTEI